MPEVDTRQLAAARVYSRSLLELGEAAGVADDLREELGELRRLLDGNADIAAFLESPLIDPAARRESLENAFRGRATDLLVDFLQVLNKKGRLPLLPTIIEAYRQAHQESRGRLDVRVITAVPLDGGLREQLKAAIAEGTGRQPDLVERVEAGLIGGVVLEIGDRKIDASVARSLGELQQGLASRGRREMSSGERYIRETPA